MTPVLELTPTQRKKYPYWELFWSKCGNIRTRITPNTDTFHAMLWCQAFPTIDNRTHY